MSDWEKIFEYSDITHQVTNKNGLILGELVIEVDGYYCFSWDTEYTMGGTWDSHGLKMLAELLDEINKPWDEEVKAFFKNQDKLFPDTV